MGRESKGNKYIWRENNVIKIYYIKHLKNEHKLIKVSYIDKKNKAQNCN